MAEVLQAGGTAVKGASGIQQVNAAQQQLNQNTQQYTKVVKELSIEEAKEKELRRQRAAAMKEEINLNPQLVGAYKANSTLLQKMIRDYKDLAMSGDANTKSAKEQLKAIQALDRQIKELDKSLGQHQRNVGNYQSALEKLRGTWGFVAAGWAAGAAALGGVVAMMGKAIQGAMDDERAERKLTLALDGNSKAAERLLRYKEQLMRTTLMGEEEIMQLINYGLAMGRTEIETKKLVDAAISLSNATGGQLDVMSAMDQLNKTYSGDLGRLKKYTGELTEEQLRNGEAVDIVNEKYKKFKSEGLSSMEGEVIQMKKWWGEAWDTIGMYAMNIINGVRTGWNTITTLMGGGVSSRGLAQQKAENTKAAQLAAHQAKMDQINAEIDQNKKLIAVNLAVLNDTVKQTGATKDQTEALKKLNEEIQVWLNTPFGQAGEGISKMPSKGIPSTVNIPGMPTGLATQKEYDAIPQTGSEISRSDEIAREAAKWNQKIQLAANAVSQIDAIVNASFNNRMAQIDAETAKDNEAKEKELAKAHGNKKQIDEIEKRYAAKEKEREKERRKVEQEQAKYKKTSGIVSAIINTAVAVTGMLANPGGILGIVLAALAGLAGAAEIAVIASQPIPSYKTGRKGGKGEIANVGEVGRELIVTKSGEMILTPPTTTTTFLPEGSSVIPHDELLNLTGRAASFMPNYSSTTTQTREDIAMLQSGFLMLRNTIQNKKEVHLSFDKRGFHTAVKNGAVWEEWVNNNVRL